jgi:hypothetical protein
MCCVLSAMRLLRDDMIMHTEGTKIETYQTTGFRNVKLHVITVRRTLKQAPQPEQSPCRDSLVYMANTEECKGRLEEVGLKV